MAIHRVGIIIAQSNGQGSPPNTTEGGADFAATTIANNAAVRFVASDNFGEHQSVAQLGMVSWADTIGNASRMPHFGPEQKIGARAVAAGWTSGGNTFTILKWTHNGTPIANFCPKNVGGNGATNGVDWYRFHRVLTLGRPPVSTFRWYSYIMQGESDCDITDGSLAKAQALGANQLALYNAMCAVVGKTAANGFLIGKICVNVWGAGQPTTGPWVPDGRASQVAIQAANPSIIGLVDNDGRTLYSQDNLHYMGASQHAQGDDVMDHPTNGWLTVG